MTCPEFIFLTKMQYLWLASKIETVLLVVDDFGELSGKPISSRVVRTSVY